jgi:phosphoribosyl 1,2-cyclic phosphate phosphodiesterase
MAGNGSYPHKKIRLVLPEYLYHRLKKIKSVYGPLLDYYETQGFVETTTFKTGIKIRDIDIAAIGVNRGKQIAFVYVMEKQGTRFIYAPCDIKPFPETRPEVMNADLLIIQPGMFESGLNHGFVYDVIDFAFDGYHININAEERSHV